jgi:hypothetical protein
MMPREEDADEDVQPVVLHAGGCARRLHATQGWSEFLRTANIKID